MEHIITYPVALLIISILSMLVFRKKLGNLIDRSHKIGPAGLEAVAGVVPQQIAQEVQQSDAVVALPPKSGSFEEYQQAVGPYRFSIAAAKSDEFRKEVDVAAYTPDQLRAMMVDLAGIVMAIVEFETIYTLIFGSQIFALENLNTVFLVGRYASELRPVYDTAAAQGPEFYKDFSFDNWLGFLVTRNLVTLDHNGIVKLSINGRDFLRWLVLAGKSNVKPG
jgi:competence protein ComGC